jgi:two-component system, OmpR family, copper resistance phosphate regulon response regulator CusR
MRDAQKFIMKVLIIEDEVKVVHSLRQGLMESDIAVDSAYDGYTGLSLAEGGQYDVIVSDIVMPRLNGIEFVKEVRKKGLQTPILLITALGATDDKVAGLDSGADDYLVKPFEFRELLARIRALSRRYHDRIRMGSILFFSDIEMNLDTRITTRSGIKIDLTPKESALLEYLIRNKERVISKQEIAEKVWDINFDTNTNVIEVYINYLRNKIDRPFEKKLIHTQFGIGYILKDEA